MGYLLLGCAIAVEVAATSALPRTHGFTQLVPTVAVLVGYALSFVLLAQVVKTMSVGLAYAIWSAVGTVAIVLIGAIFLDQPLSAWQVAGVALVVGGVLLLYLGGTTH